MELKFVRPVKKKNGEKMVKVSYKDVSSEIRRWENALVGYVFGEDPPLDSMAEFIHKWENCGNVKLYSINSGVFVFDFETAEYKQRILERAPWRFRNDPLVLRPWAPDVSLKNKEFESVRTWIQLPHLNLHLWSPQVLSKIASMVGTPLFADKLTASRERLSYARICVELEANEEQPNSVLIEDENGLCYSQEVGYEWLPPKCSSCMTFGHSLDSCPHDPLGDEILERKSVSIHPI